MRHSDSLTHIFQDLKFCYSKSLCCAALRYQIRARALDHAVGERKIGSIQAALATWDFGRDDIHAVKAREKKHQRCCSLRWFWKGLGSVLHWSFVVLSINWMQFETQKKRKEERDGQEILPCAFVHSQRDSFRYPITLFSPSSHNRKEIWDMISDAWMPLIHLYSKMDMFLPTFFQTLGPGTTGPGATRLSKTEIAGGGAQTRWASATPSGEWLGVRS